MILETPPSQSSAWDSFRIRNVGLAVQKEMAERFAGDALKMRRSTTGSVARALGIKVEEWKGAEQTAFADLALVLSLIPDLARWNEEEKMDVVKIVRAKAGADESKYLRLLQRHSRLRDWIIKIGGEEQGGRMKANDER
jgi:hypothetical protein